MMKTNMTIKELESLRQYYVEILQELELEMSMPVTCHEYYQGQVELHYYITTELASLPDLP